MSSQTSWLRVALTAAACAVIFAVGLAIVGVMYWTEPEPQREGAVRRSAMLVEVVPVERGTFQPELGAVGTVRASQSVNLQPRVSGQVVRVTEAFTPGRVVQAGEPLLTIDPADARIDLVLAESALSQAQAELALERGRQEVARAERDQITGTLSTEQEALILREPQLQSAQARVASAEAAARQARLDLSRTTLVAPFDAQVLDRSADVGSQVSPGTTVGRLIGVDSYWVELTLPAGRIALLPDAGPDATVWVRDRGAWSEDTWRAGRLDGIVRQVDDQTRLARLLVVVDDPLSIETDAPALTAGAFVEARVEAKPLVDVIRIPRELLRRGDTVWEKEGDELRIRQVQVIVEDGTYAYIRDGLSADALVVSTDLATVTDGAALRTEAE